MTKVSARLRRETRKTRQFFFQKMVYLGDTNAEGNVYFARFFDWQGMAREEFYRKFVPGHSEILKSGVRIITLEAQLNFRNQLFLFDEVLIEVRTRNVRTASLELVFIYRNKKTDQVVADGYQKLSFSDPGGKIMLIPLSVKESASHFLIEPTPESEEALDKGKQG